MSVAVAEQFQSLYRRYRPQRFSEVRGQGHVVLGLRNAVRDDRVAHAYLFSGPRGTGKTSTARILAKALNCTAPEEDGEPCGRCDSCIDIARGASLDVHELDAASNNGVDAMRDLVARAALATPGKWKVYIVDEVHMLSTAASNALLKTLEEPPSHVVFVLATTDPQKVLPTIRSRTQHFEFHLLEASTLETLLTDIAGDAHLDLPPDGIEAAVRRAHGSARDALSALDLVAAAGVVDDEDRFVRELVAALADRDTSLALHTVEAAMVAGFDAARLAGELVDGLRDVFLSAMAPELRRPSAAPPEQGGPVIGPARCVRALEVIGTAIVDMREALDARITFEVALVRLTHPEVDDGPGALLERIERLERRVQELSSGSGAPAPSLASAVPRPVEPGHGDAMPAAPGGGSSQPEPPGSTGSTLTGKSAALGAYLQQPAPPASPAAAPAAPSAPAEPRQMAPAPGSSAGTETPAQNDSAAPTRDDLVTAWGDHVLSSLRPRARAVYAAGRFVAVEDGVAVFALPNPSHVEHALPLVKEVAEAISRQAGARVGLRLIIDTDGVTAAPEDDGSDDPGGAGGRSAGGTSAPRPRSRSSSGATGAGRSEPSGRGRRDPSPRRPPSEPPATAPSRPEADEEMSDFEDLAPGEAGGRHDSLSWAEGRLLEAFPGAEEVP
jgi:DNA polymerase-3 subunit gamma/tau